MKRVLNFFARPEEQLRAARTTYVSREPTLNPRSAVPPRATQAARAGSAEQASEAVTPPSAAPRREPIPNDYAGIVDYFQKKVRERKSPYNGLVTAAETLKDFIPDETTRLKAVLAVCSDKWPLDALSLAISTHISDIELARNKAKDESRVQATENISHFREQADRLRQENQKIEEDINALNESIRQLQNTLRTNQSTLASLNEKIQLAQVNANSASFIDQAADNLKNDLLAKKVILGLP